MNGNMLLSLLEAKIGRGVVQGAGEFTEASRDMLVNSYHCFRSAGKKLKITGNHYDPVGRRRRAWRDGGGDCAAA
jgi:hypothetical protein